MGSEVDLNEVAGLVEERHGELGIGRDRGMDELSGGRILAFLLSLALKVEDKRKGYGLELPNKK